MRILVDYSHQELFRFPLDRVGEIRQPVAPEGVRFEWIDEISVGDGTGWLGGLRIRHFRCLLRRGDIGLYGYLDEKPDEPVSYLWCLVRVPGRHPVNAHDPIEPGEAFLHRGYVRPEARRRGILIYTLFKMLDLLDSVFVSQGIEQVYTVTLVENEAPQRVLLKLGFTHVGRITTLVLLGHCFIYWSRDVQPDGSLGPGRLRVRFKLPEILWDPAFDRFRSRQSVAVHPPT